MFGKEPALWIGLITSALAFMVAFGIDVTEDQKEAILKLVASVLPFFGAVATRQMVVPVTKVEEKGLDPKTLNPKR